jgi:hypothetical protein
VKERHDYTASRQKFIFQPEIAGIERHYTKVTHHCDSDATSKA